MSVIKDIFYGKLSAEMMPLTSASKKQLKKATECEDRIKEQIADKKLANQLLIDLTLLESKMNGIRNLECFEYGFRLGMKLILELYR